MRESAVITPGISMSIPDMRDRKSLTMRRSTPCASHWIVRRVCSSFSRTFCFPSHCVSGCTLFADDTFGGSDPVVCEVVPYGTAGDDEGSDVMGTGASGIALRQPGTGTAP